MKTKPATYVHTVQVFLENDVVCMYIQKIHVNTLHATDVELHVSLLPKTVVPTRLDGPPPKIKTPQNMGTMEGLSFWWCLLLNSMAESSFSIFPVILTLYL